MLGGFATPLEDPPAMGLIALPLLGSVLAWLAACVAAVVLGFGRLRWNTPGGRWAVAAGLLGLAAPAVFVGSYLWAEISPPRDGDDSVPVLLTLMALGPALFALSHVCFAAAVRAVAAAAGAGR